MASVTEELNCSICLEMYTDAVTLPCGHNFCRACILRFLDTQFGVPSCPDCRAHFPQRPALQKNITLCNVVTHYRSSPRREAAGGGVHCTYCIRSAVPALKSCLHCEASLCADHLQVHSTAPEHILAEHGATREDRKCPAHKEVLKYFCREDSACICVSCRLDGEHRGHRAESLEEASEKKKEDLREVLQKLTSEREDNEKKIHRLWEHRRLVREQQASLLMADLIRQLELKKMDLTGKIGRVARLCDEADPLTVLLDHEPEVWGNAEDEAAEDLYRGLVSGTLDADHVCEDLVLDVTTAANNVRVSPDLKTLTWSAAYQKRPETPVRFQYNQVLSSRRFSSGQHSWDVETSESGDWRIGVAYQSVERRGERSYIGDSGKSWCLRKLYQNQYSAMHDGNVTTAPHRFSSTTFRICLDYEAGRVSFYELSDPIRLLHTFTATFTEPLHAAFGVGYWLCSEGCWLRVVI
ncbi:PREDICTED: E3 ubiquitin/ISG15 ligase TRIM25-like [Nanorana parkeri]|uniref:E3 ubiquitin/ISG15 ligase TRIM25-like n=1 Tax=Nanorana parkeri TaxID=125878 RepID=UPI000854C047|nr:PREDICTED: E3 ubiquitin/ISG15 ligase TRIM25-like [Nanorana parkeri]